MLPDGTYPAWYKGDLFGWYTPLADVARAAQLEEEEIDFYD
jgi:hypothetical protein